VKLSYWVARAVGDSQVYSIREKTRKAAVARRKEYGEEHFEPPVKVSFEYDNAFDLMKECLSEGGGYWEG
jgi:hypothetical protein